MGAVSFVLFARLDTVGPCGHCDFVHAMSRKIIHVDLDCFFAQVEMLRDPSLREIPMGVGGSDRHGILTTCNYEARKFGCRSGMPIFIAKERCPQIVVIRGSYPRYREISRTIRGFFFDVTSLVEPLSIDEAFLDVTEHDEPATRLARQLRRRVVAETGLTCSAGISFNKTLAKIATSQNKPDGQFTITPEDAPEFLARLPVEELSGVGPSAREALHRAGLRTCGDIQRQPIADLIRRFGKWGWELQQRASGHDDRPVTPWRPRKSLSVERTFSQRLGSLEEVLRELDGKVLPEFWNDFQQSGQDRELAGCFVKLGFADRSTTTVSHAEVAPTREVFAALLAEGYPRGPSPIRLVGVGVRFADDPRGGVQLTFDHAIAATA